jgi:hypothetical protein
MEFNDPLNNEVIELLLILLEIYNNSEVNAEDENKAYEIDAFL